MGIKIAMWSGPRDSDGVWDKCWYDSVLASTGFSAPVKRGIELDTAARCGVETCLPAYETLFRHRLRAT